MYAVVKRSFAGVLLKNSNYVSEVWQRQLTANVKYALNCVIKELEGLDNKKNVKVY